MKALSGMFVFVVFVALLGCSDKGAFVPPTPPSTPEEYNSLLQKSGEAPVEQVSGQPVFPEDVEVVLKRHPDWTKKEALGFLAYQRRLALEALKEGHGSDFSVQFRFRQALARRVFEKLFKEEHSPDSVPTEVWHSLYNDPQIYRHFDHHEAHYVVDLQYICCGGNPNLCRTDKKVEECISEAKDQMEQLHAALEGHHFDTREEFMAFAAKLRNANFPQIAIREYNFYYDYDLPHDQQKGFNIVSESVAWGAKKAGIHNFSKLVRSWAGWHILYVDNVIPEQHRKFNDPGVVEELQSKFYNQVLQHDILTFLDKVSKRFKLVFLEENLREVDWAEVSGIPR